MGFNMTLGKSQIYPPLPTMAEPINKEIAKQDVITSINVLAGFDHIVDGKEYHFSYKSEDQSNFNMGIGGANTCLQLSAMSEDQLAATYPGYRDKDGNLHPEVLPGGALADTWVVSWRGHADGQAYTLLLNPMKFLDLANAAAVHNQKQLAIGWAIKAKLEACKTEAELKALVKELDLDRKLSDAKDLAAKKGLK